MFHFHRWTEYIKAKKDPKVQGGKYSEGSYRHCDKCDRWEESVCDYGGCDWEECEEPSGKLILESDWEYF